MNCPSSRSAAGRRSWGRCPDFGEASVGLGLRQMDLDEARLVGGRDMVAEPARPGFDPEGVGADCQSRSRRRVRERKRPFGASQGPDPRRLRAVALSSGPRLKASWAPPGAAPPGSRTRWSASDGEEGDGPRRNFCVIALKARTAKPAVGVMLRIESARSGRWVSILAARLAGPRPARTSARAARASASAAAALDWP